MTPKHLCHLSLTVVCLSLLLAGATACKKPEEAATDTFIQDETAWRAERDQQMKAPESWLSIAGLFWLEEGENTFGTAEANAIKLPEGSAPAFAGKFVFSGGKTEVVSTEGVILTSDGEEVKHMALKNDLTGKPDIIALNDLRLWVILRGDRYAIRLRDLNAPAYKNYRELDFFPPDPAYRMEAEFAPYSGPKKVTIATAVGTVVDLDAKGIVKFRIRDRECELEAFESGKDQLFFIFRDGTSGKETYGASRFMAADILAPGKIDLNFNRAYNPPCAYTDFATCPLSPAKNVLSVRIEAGEKNYPGVHH